MFLFTSLHSSISTKQTYIMSSKSRGSFLVLCMLVVFLMGSSHHVSSMTVTVTLVTMGQDYNYYAPYGYDCLMIHQTHTNLAAISSWIVGMEACLPIIPILLFHPTTNFFVLWLCVIVQKERG